MIWSKLKFNHLKIKRNKMKIKRRMISDQKVQVCRDNSLNRKPVSNLVPLKMNKVQTKVSLIKLWIINIPDYIFWMPLLQGQSCIICVKPGWKRPLREWIHPDQICISERPSTIQKIAWFRWTKTRFFHKSMAMIEGQNKAPL